MKILKRIARVLFESLFFCFLLGASITITWLVFSFVAYDLNPAGWHWLGRVIFASLVLAYLSALVFMYASYYGQSGGKSKNIA